MEQLKSFKRNFLIILKIINVYNYRCQIFIVFFKIYITDHLFPSCLIIHNSQILSIYVS